MRSCCVMGLKIVSLFLLSTICLNISHCKSDKNNTISEEENLELERILELRNKPPVTTIKTDDGRTIDCIDVHKQPSLDHPLLKNHNVQLRPSYIPEGLKRNRNGGRNALEEAALQMINCPEGTVPIQRTTKEDLIRTKPLLGDTINGLGTEEAATPSVRPGRHKVYVKVNKSVDDVQYSAVSGIVSLFNYNIDPDQSTSTNIWVQSEGESHHQNFITAGWKIDQTLNGDYRTRLFTYWVGDSNPTGCYNTLCNGFIQVNPNVPPDVPIWPVSIPGGQQKSYTLSLFLDPVSCNWWLKVSYINQMVGYWPCTLFNPEFGSGAYEVGWGAQTQEGASGISPPMGNGYKPSKHYEKSCYFYNAMYVSKHGDRTLFPADDKDEVVTYVDRPGCYFLENDGYRGDDFNYVIRFGGPGGHC